MSLRNRFAVVLISVASVAVVTIRITRTVANCKSKQRLTTFTGGNVFVKERRRFYA